MRSQPPFGYVRRAPAPAGVVQFEYDLVFVASATETIYVVRPSGTNACSVDFATSDGEGTAGVDYDAQSGTVSWADDDIDPQPIVLTGINYGAFSFAETIFSVTLSDPTDASLGDPIVCAIHKAFV